MIPHSKDAVMKQHLEQWKTSGTTQRAYCRKNNIPHHIFSYYKKKLQSKLSPSTVAFKNQLIPVELVVQEEVSKTITISHRNGFSFEINPNTQLREFKPLLELLSSVS